YCFLALLLYYQILIFQYDAHQLYLHSFPTRRSSDLLKWLETNNLFNNLIQRNQSAAFSSGKVRPNHETNINIIARRTGKDVNSHTVLDGIITTIMATIQRINIIGSREGSR